MEEIYEIKSNVTEKIRDLYYKENEEKELNFLTYFNSFSLKKWKKYTSIKKLAIELRIKGKFKIQLIGLDEEKKVIILEKNIENNFFLEVLIEELDYEIIGITLLPLEKKSKFITGRYLGEFYNQKKIDTAIVICTYKREKYLEKTLKTLKEYIEKTNEISVTVIDNGKTLKEVSEKNLKIIHNLNYGGSGGFTRGIIENQEKSDYILLMDDDIELDTEVLKKTNKLLQTLKDEYRQSFLAGSMLNLDNPTIQTERTALWNGINSEVNGEKFNLADTKFLLLNEKIEHKNNNYAGWWFCAIPNAAIKNIGLPLPIFIKGDDVEYSLRNEREIISLNGIGVWHEPFEKKESPATYYYWTRNSLIINSLGKKGKLFCCFFLLKTIHNSLKLDRERQEKLYKSLVDFNLGIDKLLRKNPKEKHEEVLNYRIDSNINSVKLYFMIILKSLEVNKNYNKISIENKKFKEEKLLKENYWKKILEI